jgi:hypothetical protein
MSLNKKKQINEPLIKKETSSDSEDPVTAGYGDKVDDDDDDRF